MEEQRQADGSAVANEAAAAHSPYVPIELDKPRRLKLDLNAMVSYEEATRKKFTAIDGENLGPAELRTILWAMLKHEDKDLTVEDVGGMVHIGNINSLTAAITAAVSLGATTSNPPHPRGQERPTG